LHANICSLFLPIFQNVLLSRRSSDKNPRVTLNPRSSGPGSKIEDVYLSSRCGSLTVPHKSIARTSANEGRPAPPRTVHEIKTLNVSFARKLPFKLQETQGNERQKTANCRHWWTAELRFGIYLSELPAFSS
jgi:hypothetical protein